MNGTTLKPHHWPDEQPNKFGNDPIKPLFLFPGPVITYVFT